MEAATLVLLTAVLAFALIRLVGFVRGPAAGFRRAVRIVVLGIVALVLVAWAARRLSDSRTYQLFGEIVPRVDTTEPLVALTFDDGPSALYTDSVLAVLRRAGVRATFFLNGSAIVRDPASARAIAAAGHEIGNHTWDHPRMVLKSAGFARTQVARTDSAIRGIGFEGPIHFRPPYGKKLIALPWVLACDDRTTVMWDVEPDSYAAVASTAQGIVAHVRERVRPGSIVLLHVMAGARATSRAALPGLIEALRAEGYTFVTVSELLAAGMATADSPQP